jgi:hypothetical protein
VVKKIEINIEIELRITLSLLQGFQNLVGLKHKKRGTKSS